MKKQWYLLSFLLLCLLSNKAYSKRIKDFDLYKDAITVINTTPGYTTLIEVPEKPSRVVLGDQGNFLVEFVGKNLAVKPVGLGKKTNLFIFTRSEQFHVTLVSGPQYKLQYIVRLNNKKNATKNLDLKRKRKDVFVHLTQYKRALYHNCHQITFLIENIGDRDLTLEPDKFEVYCSKKRLPIASVYVDDLTVPKQSTIKSKILFHADNLMKCSAINIELSIKDQKPLLFPFIVKELK